MSGGIIAITNAAAAIVWAAGIGAVRVEYTLDPATIVSTNRQPHTFADDAATGTRTVNTYARSGYDRGHLAPAADFAGRDALAMTYLSSNLTPMRPSFNRGAWATVEREVRDTARRLGVPIQVTTIPVYGGTNRLGGVVVPTALVKLVATNGVTVAAWLREQGGVE